MKTHYYFKLFNSIKEEHEFEFAELELSSLFGEVKRIQNFQDIIQTTPFKYFTGKECRIQDILSYETPYGKWHGFYAERDPEFSCLKHLVNRLAYTCEFFVITKNKKNVTGERPVQLFERQGYFLARFVTNQYFLEKSQYISKLSRNEQEVRRNVQQLLEFPLKGLYRIPASSTMSVGKRLEDYFAIREEPSLYLTHYMHPYKGKFHPKMVRALLNYVYPKPQGCVMDNFAGCGTLLVEATVMGLNSIGVEINPLSSLMSNVKCFSLSLDAKKLKDAINSYLKEVNSALAMYAKQASGYALLSPPKYKIRKLKQEKSEIPEKVVKMFREPRMIDDILIAHEICKHIPDSKIRNFILLGLSGTISDATRRRSGKFIDMLCDRLKDLYLRVFLFHELNWTLGIRLGNSITYVADTRDMREVKSETIDAIVNSPPYSTALDYIRNDLPQLTLLKLADVERLEKDMMGNPKFKVYSDSLLQEMREDFLEYRRLPTDAKKTITKIRKAGRKKQALRTYKFYKDMYLALQEMYRVLKPGAKAVIIIGNNHYKLNDDYEEVRNDETIKEMAIVIGFKEDRIIRRKLEKSMSGMIRYESIVIIQK